MTEIFQHCSGGGGLQHAANPFCANKSGPRRAGCRIQRYARRAPAERGPTHCPRVPPGLRLIPGEFRCMCALELSLLAVSNILSQSHAGVCPF